MLEAARLHGAERVVMISTAAVARGSPAARTRRQSKEGAAAAQLLLLRHQVGGENLGYNYARSHGVDFRAVRFPTVRPLDPGRRRPPQRHVPHPGGEVGGRVEHTVPRRMEWLYSKDAAAAWSWPPGRGVKSRVFNLGVGKPTTTRAVEIFKQ